MAAPKLTSVQIRRGTKAQWDAANPQLLDGEIGFETDTYRIKIGRRNDNGELIFWEDLLYQSPFSGKAKPVYPQAGDFWIDDTTATKELFYFDGDQWKAIQNQFSPTFEGTINIEDACITGDLEPCADNTYKIGTDDKKWKEINMGDDVTTDSYKISVGDSTHPDNIGGNYRLQLNGDDIAVRGDFGDIDSRDLTLWRGTSPNGEVLPIPTEYGSFTGDPLRNLPDRGGIGNQAQYNEWVLAALLGIVGSDQAAGGATQDFWNKNIFNSEFTAKKGVNTPVSGNETDYDNKTDQSTYLHRADGTVSDKIPLDQSYWTDVTALTKVRRRR